MFVAALLGAALSKARATAPEGKTSVRAVNEVLFLLPNRTISDADVDPGGTVKDRKGVEFLATDPDDRTGAGYVGVEAPDAVSAEAGADDAARYRILQLKRALDRQLAAADPSSAKARAAVQRLKSAKRLYRFRSEPTPNPGVASPRNAWRGALIGLLVGGVLLIALRYARNRREQGALAVLAVGGVGVATLVASVRPSAQLVVLLGLVGLIGLGTAARSRSAVRTLLWVILAVNALRGLELYLAMEARVPNALLFVNLISPVLVGASGLAALWHERGIPRRLEPLLLWGLGVSVVAVGLDLLTTTSTPKVYVIGVGQYLVYPVFALLAYWAWEPRDRGRTLQVICGVGLLVAASIGVQAVGITDFVQAAGANVGTDVSRYGGATGSYLHAGIFLGTTAIVMLGFTLMPSPPRTRVLRLLGVAVMLGGLILTYGRAGFVIAGVGVIVLLVASPARARKEIVVAIVAVVVLAAVPALVSQVGVSGVGGRLASSTDTKDPGNKLRLHDMNAGLARWADASLPQKALGLGVATTGNAGKLADNAPVSVESYPIKLLDEVGVVGLLLVGGFILLALRAFMRLARSSSDAIDRGLAAAGIGLTVDAVAFPTLEVQLIAGTWFALLAVTLVRLHPRPPPGDAIAKTRAGAPRGAVAVALSRLTAITGGGRVKASSTTLLGTAVGAACAFAAAVVAARGLPLDAFAAFGVGLAIHSLVQQFGDAGLGTVYVVRSAEDWDSGLGDRGRATLRAMLGRRVVASALVALPFVLGAALLPGIDDYRLPAVLGAAGAVGASTATFLTAALQAAQRFETAGVTTAAVGVARLLLTVVAVVATSSASWAMAGYAVAGPACVAIVAAVVAVGRGGASSASASGAVPDSGLTRNVAIAFVAAAVMYNADVLLLLALGSDHDVAVYSAAWRVGAGVLLLCTALSTALLPSVMTSRDAWRQALTLNRIGLGVAAALLVASPVAAFGGALVLGDVGSDARWPLLLLVVAFALEGYTLVVHLIYLRAGSAAMLPVVALAQLIAMVVVTLLLRNADAAAPAYGHLAAGSVGALITAAPLVLARRGRLSWFDVPLARDPVPVEMAAR